MMNRSCLTVIALASLACSVTLGACGSVAATAGPDADSAADASRLELEGSLTSGLTESASDDGGTRTNVPGRYDHVVDVGGLPGRFIVYVPELAAGNIEVPVVFMLHGTGGDGERFLNISGWREKADEEGFIAVFPSALTYCLFEDENGDGDFDDRGDRHVTTKWAGGKLGDPERMPLCTPEDLTELRPAARARADHALRDDVAFMDAIVDLLEAEYAVDAQRLYVSGFSNGGQMVSRLAAERSTVFAAFNASAGSLALDPPPVAERPASLVFTLGERDDRFAANLPDERLPLDETLVSLPLTQFLVGKYLASLQLDETYTYTEGTVSGRRFVRFQFDQSLVGADNSFALVVLGGLFHQYPNGDNYPLRLADPLWDFFSANPLQ